VTFSQFVTDYSGAIGAVLGFLAGLISAEYAEWRRRWIRKKNIRQALVGELRSLEALMSLSLIRLSHGIPNPIRAIAEFRWYIKEGYKQWDLGLNFSDQYRAELLKLSDEELKTVVASYLTRPGTPQTAKFRVPILDGVLSKAEVGFTMEEIHALSNLRWQITSTEKEIDNMDQYLLMSFTITDAENHKKVVENRKAAEAGLRQRLGYALDAIRETLTKLYS
jgi:hypothetical protein